MIASCTIRRLRHLETVSLTRRTGDRMIAGPCEKKLYTPYELVKQSDPALSSGLLFRDMNLPAMQRGPSHGKAF